MVETNRYNPTPGTGAPPATRATSVGSEVPAAATQATPQVAPGKGADKLHFRTIWISDIHLGTRGCKADFLLDFLHSSESEYLYLVGDIIDAWQLRKSWYWPESHNEVLRLLLKKAHRGTKVVFIPGNHDELFRGYTELAFGGVSLVDSQVHVAADGRRYLVIHGDVFDGVVTCAKWLALLGDQAYQVVLRANTLFNRIRRRLGYPYWSLSSYLKQKVKNAVSHVSRFEAALAEHAEKQGLDGVICGHIHKAELQEVGGLVYANDGDWVESCTALVEDHKGRLELLRWAEYRNLSFFDA